MKENKYSEDNHVVKANDLIEAKGRLTVVEQKLLATLISEIRADDKDFKVYNLNIREIAEFMNLNSNAVYEQIKTAARNLRNKEIVIEKTNKEGKKSFLVTGILSSAKYNEGEGTLEVYIDPNLKPYLIAIKGEETPFTKYMIKNILKLNRSYSIRLYEILKQWEKVRTKKFEIKKLKEMLGAEEASYNRIDNFERRVLEPAKKEINEKTDIFVVFRKIKTGRRISHIEFDIETQVGHFNLVEAEHRQQEESGVFDYKFVKENAGMGEEKFSREQIYEIYNTAVQKVNRYRIDELAYIQMNYEYAKERAKRGLYSYVLKAIKHDYAKAILKLAQIEV